MTENDPIELAKAIECILFASAETLSPQRLAEIAEIEPDRVEPLMDAVHGLLEGRGLQLVHLAGGYQLATRPDYANYVHRLLQPVPARLSTQALEVLAIIAYRQPITRPEVDDVRGVNSQHSVATLAEKGLITTIGRKDAPGRPVLYGTTPHFLSSFGLKDLNDLPNLQALRQAVLREPQTVLSGVSQTGELESEAIDASPEFGPEAEDADGAAPEIPAEEGDDERIDFEDAPVEPPPAAVDTTEPADDEPVAAPPAGDEGGAPT